MSHSDDDEPFLEGPPMPEMSRAGLLGSISEYVRENKPAVAVWSIGALVAILYCSFLLGQLVSSYNHPVWVADIEVAEQAVFPEIEICPFSSSVGATLRLLACLPAGYDRPCNYSEFSDPDTHAQCYRIAEGVGPSNQQQKLTVTLRLGLETLMGLVACFRPPGTNSTVCSQFDAGKSSSAFLSPSKAEYLSGRVVKGFEISAQSVSLYVDNAVEYAQVSFFWQSMTTKVQKEVVTYSWLAFLGQCAGVLSLVYEICPLATKFISKRLNLAVE